MKVSVGIVIIAVIISAASAAYEDEDQRKPNTLVVRGGIRMFKLDRECAMVGGICVAVDDCDPNYQSTTTGLCPSSQSQNVECCYRYKRRENNTCDQYQGTCMSNCHPAIRHSTKDCGDQFCCTLV